MKDLIFWIIIILSLSALGLISSLIVYSRIQTKLQNKLVTGILISAVAGGVMLASSLTEALFLQKEKWPTILWPLSTAGLFFIIGGLLISRSYKFAKHVAQILEKNNQCHPIGTGKI